MEAFTFQGENGSEALEAIPIEVENTDVDELRIDFPLKELKEGTLFLSLDHLEHVIRIAKERIDTNE